jgi:pyrimidine oxygenase
VQAKPEVVVATGSEWGYDFVGKTCNEAFIGGRKPQQVKDLSPRIKNAAMENYGRKVKTSIFVNLILAPTDAEADAILLDYWAGADLEAINNVQGLRKMGDGVMTPAQLQAKFDSGDISSLFYAGYPFVGGPQKVVDFMEDLAVNGQLDGLLFTFPDFVKGLKYFDKLVMPLLRERNLIGNADVPKATVN